METGEERMRNILLWTAFMMAGAMLAGCAAAGVPPITPSPVPTESSPEAACPVTEPAWVKPPEDSAVQDPPAYGFYFVNEDSSIWASAWYVKEEDPLRVSEEGIKVGWFRPEGAALLITGQRLDGEAPPLEAEASCCYPTRFQASGLYFPTEGCWEVTAKAEESELTFVVWVEPG
jgi:hypothetical protein